MKKDTTDWARHKNRLNGDDIGMALTKARIDLAVVSTKLKKYGRKEQRVNNNRLFDNSHKQCYNSLHSTSHVVANPPSKEHLEAFWSGLLGKELTHNSCATWLEVEKESVQGVPEQD
eukprot:223376-Ditylum_brightwellii.AAC.1